MKYFNIGELLEMIEGPNCGICRRILEDNRVVFRKVQGSSHNHQNWVGGYLDHVVETMNVAVMFYASMSECRHLDSFSLSDALLVLFLHDLEKPWKYRLNDNGEVEYVDSLKTKDAAQKFRDDKMSDYGLILTPEQVNGLHYVEGEYKDYSNKTRIMWPLAAFCHLCDVVSSRIWHEYPKAGGDSWNLDGRAANPVS